MNYEEEFEARINNPAFCIVDCFANLLLIVDDIKGRLILRRALAHALCVPDDSEYYF